MKKVNIRTAMEIHEQNRRAILANTSRVRGNGTARGVKDREQHRNGSCHIYMFLRPRNHQTQLNIFVVIFIMILTNILGN